MNQLNKTDNQLMADFAGCSRDAFEEIYERYKNRLLNYVRKGLVYDRTVSEDILQDTFIQVYKYKYKYKPKYEFSTWVYTIARNFAINHLRKQNRYKNKELEQEVISDNKLKVIFENEELSNILYEKIKQLKPVQREIIILRYFDGMSYQEISKLLSINVNTLKSHSRRALRKLKSDLERNKIEI